MTPQQANAYLEPGGNWNSHLTPHPQGCITRYYQLFPPCIDTSDRPDRSNQAIHTPVVYGQFVQMLSQPYL